MGVGLSIHPAEALAAAAAGLGADRNHLHPLQPFSPAWAEALLQQLRGVLRCLAAAEGDGINVPSSRAVAVGSGIVAGQPDS